MPTVKISSQPECVDQRVAEIRQQLLRAVSEHRDDDVATGEARYRDCTVAGRRAHVGRDRGPLHLGQAVLVLRQHDAPGVAERALVVLMQQEARDVAQVEPPEAADRGVRLEAVAQRALLVVEAELLDQRAVQHDQRLRPRRVAGMLDAVLRIGHRLGQRDQDGHVFRPAAGHHAVHRDVPHRGHAVVGQELADGVIGRQVGEGEELGDLLLGRRHDRQAVAPAVLEEEAIDLLEAAVEHDVLRIGIAVACTAAISPVRLRITWSTVVPSTLARSSSDVCTSTWPGTVASARLG